MRVRVVGASGKLGRYMVEALENDVLVHEAPAIVGCRTSSALTYAASGRTAPAVPTA
jgi:uncharacterized protein YbjT (DUF2867 family)